MSARPPIFIAAGAVCAAALLALAAAGCAIGADDLLPAIGAPCQTSAALCSVEHVCRPGDSPPNGLCAPVGSYGACDELDGPPSHPPGRLGEIKDATEVKIASAADLEQLREVRMVTGSVEIFEVGPGNAEVGTLCALRDLQVVGNGLGIGDSDLIDLDGLQSLTSVTAGLAIFNNRELTSLQGLENLVEVTGRALEGFQNVQLIIAGNPLLPEEEVTALEDRLRQSNGGALASVSCSNRANACEGAELQLLTLLASSGVPR